MNKAITFLAKVGFWQFVVIFTVLAVSISELLMVINSYWLTGDFFDKNLLIVGFIAPLIYGFVVFPIIAFLIHHLKSLQDEKDRVIALQKKTKEKLDYQKKRALQYLDITGTIIVALDTLGNIILANKETCKALGVESEDTLIGKNWLKEYLPKSIYKKIYEDFKDFVNGNIEPYKTYENELLFRDGSIRLIEWNNEYIRDNNGKITGVLSSGRDVTKSREAEEKLKKSESYQRAILDSFPFFVWLKDTNSNFLAVNMAVAKAVGLDNPSKLIGKSDLDIFPKDLADAYRSDDKEVMKTLQKKELEELVEDNGERRWHQTYKAPILDEDGTLFGTVGFARDITKDRLFEEELKLMKYALDNAEEGVYLTDERGYFKYVSDGAVRQLDYTKEEFKRMGISDIDSDFKISSLSTFFQQLKQKSSITFRSRHKSKSGMVFPVEINANYIEYRGNEYSLAFVRDITSRKQIEDRLKLLASVFTFAHEGIIITDANNDIIDVNDAFVEITGFSHDEVLGKNPKILQSGHNNEKFYAEMWESLKSKGVWRGELLNRKKSKEEYVQNSTISVVYNERGMAKNYIAIFTDITVQKEQQQKLEYIAHHDMLTDLPNRVLFIDRMHQAMAQAVRRKQLIAVVYIDLDGFKEVNDNYGHEIGDKLLILLSQKMNSLLREGDTISRVGGDEFIALLVDIVNKSSVISFLTRVLDVVSEEIIIDGFPINVSASIGITFYPQQEEFSAEQIIKQADKAMYQAKDSGKNRYVIFKSLF